MTLTSVCYINESIHSSIHSAGSKGTLPALQILCLLIHEKNLTDGGWVGSVTWNITVPLASHTPMRYITGGEEGLGTLEILMAFTVCTATPRLPPSSGQFWKIFYLFFMGEKKVNSSFVVPKSSVGFWRYLPRALNWNTLNIKIRPLPFPATAHLRAVLTLPLMILSPGYINYIN